MTLEEAIEIIREWRESNRHMAEIHGYDIKLFVQYRSREEAMLDVLRLLRKVSNDQPHD